jgi:lipoyl(octanoyl) transferase
MSVEPPVAGHAAEGDRTLQVYLLGSVDFEAALALQHRLVFEVASNRSRAVLILCEHPPGITIGRQGSRAHLLCEPEEFRARQWRVRWVNRGGGCLLHLPGQMMIYPILALDRLGHGLQAYLDRLQEVGLAVLADFGVHGETRPGQPGIWVGPRPIAGIGVAVRDWVTYFGAALNINPALDAFRLVRCGGPNDGPMTSLERERRGPLRPSMVRERFVEYFAERFQFDRTAIFFNHPSLSRKARADAFAARS